MTTVNIVKNENTFFVPALDVLAVYNAASKDQVRYYLMGVYVETRGDDTVIVATDGHIMLKTITPSEAFVGDKVPTQHVNDAAGFILKTDVTEKAFKAKTTGDLWVYGDTSTGLLHFVDVHSFKGKHVFERVGVCEFSRTDGTYPDYTRVLPNFNAETSVPVALNPDLLVRLIKAGKTHSNIKTAGMRLNASGLGDPIAISYKQSPRLQGVIMPLRF